MAILVQGAGSLKRHLASATTVEDVHTVGEAIQKLDLPEVGGELIMLVNGRAAHWNTELHDGDTLQLMPGISGGWR